MLELYQFELSEYCEKVRFILDYKGLEYRKIEVTPGLGQLEVFRLSGQRQVPVLKDGGRVVADSTAIVRYLEEQYPDRPILPTDAKQKALTLILEEWADEAIGINARKALVSAVSDSQSFRTSLLPSSTPPFLKNLVGAVPGEVLNALATGMGATGEVVKNAKDALKQDLDSLVVLLADSPYLTGSQPTLADFAVAAMTLYIKFPDGPYLDIPGDLRGKGVPGLAENPAYASFFTWRDRLYQSFRKPLGDQAISDTAPTRIQID
ncbi:MAG: glutathione S-transferase family protein [Leptolyngbyaceae cyanobacterium bins.59]|nr:glutathione S-transferase family protein [Leptolyngbyaceae cyanobacterium bins.59]